jgi:hypothetical protein
MVEVRIFQIHRSIDDRFWRFVIPNLIGNRNASALRFPPAPIVWSQLIITFFYRSMPRGMVLWSAKVPKALCQSSNEPFAQSHAHQKNSDTSFCVQYFFLKIKLSVMNTKPLRFRFVSAIFTVVHLFF